MNERSPAAQSDPIQPSAFEPLDSAAPATAGRRHPLRWALGGAAALFLLVMLFLLTARSLLVIVEAESEARVSISGLAIPFGERYLLRPGTYTLSATAEGYYPLRTEVTVSTADSQSTTLVMAPLPGLLSVDSRPAGATVLVDGESIGRTPLAELAVAAGEHSLRVEAPRYRPHERSLLITGRNLPQQLSIQLEPAWAEITVDSRPAGAEILVDGETAGRTPATLDITEGERQLILRSPTYADWVGDLSVVAGQGQDLGTIDLQPAAGMLTLDSSPSGANVTLDGEFQGQTPLQLEITPGRPHRLSVFKPGHRRFSDTVEMAAATTASRTVKLQAQLGDVRVDIVPANAVLRVNGSPVGMGSRTLALPAVEHRLDVVLDGYASQTRRVTPRPGLLQRISVTLQTEAEARMARIKPEITTPAGQTLLLFNPEESPLAAFSMGASRREAGRRANEVLHPVALQRMFYLQTTEVTNAQFRQFEPAHKSGQIEGNSLNRDQQPVVGISWQQAASFCNWLSRKEGLPPFYRENQGIIVGYNPSSTGYRLPSEAEWAWAARTRGEELLRFPWGDTFPPADATENYADSTSAYVTGRILTGYKDGHVVSAPVASYPPNHRGLYDLGGNVAEWIHDVYTIPPANGTTQVDPLGAQSGDNYVIRGASWSHSRLAELRLSYRDYGQAGRDDVGFRIARYAE